MAEVAALVEVPATVLDPSEETLVVALSFGNAIVVDWPATGLVALVLASSAEEVIGAALVVGTETSVEVWTALLDVVGAATGAEVSTVPSAGALVATFAVVEESTIGMTVIPGAEDVTGAWL